MLTWNYLVLNVINDTHSQTAYTTQNCKSIADWLLKRVVMLEMKNNNLIMYGVLTTINCLLLSIDLFNLCNTYT